MKFLHLSDLHLGKHVNGYSMLEAQRDILQKILQIQAEEQTDGVILAGDLYDKPIPPAEAVVLLDEFLSELAKRNQQVFLISGNHDSQERLAFGARLFGKAGIHAAPVYQGEIAPIVLHDDFGELYLYLVPFLKPAQVRRFAGEKAEISSYTDAMAYVVEQLHIDPARRNVLVTHQFVTGAATCESEELSIGGSENIDGAVFAPFDYVALGHLHRPQNCGSERMRYCGTPLKYSFSEWKDQKSVTIVTLEEKGTLRIATRPLTPLRDLVELRGSYAQVMAKSFYENTSWQEDYTHIILTDEEDIPDAASKLRAVYRHLMKLDYDNTRTRQQQEITADAQQAEKSPLELFGALYEMQNNQPLSAEQSAFLEKLMEEIREELS